jgi:TPR repeat protein
MVTRDTTAGVNMIFFKRLTLKSLTKKAKAMQQNRLLNQPSDALLAKEIDIYLTMARIYQAFRKTKKNPFTELMVRECLRAATTLDSSSAQYDLGQKLLEEAKFRDKLEKEGVFANASNQRQAFQLFEEAHAYLLSAENLSHVLAKRLRGLCYINGWGVEVDKNKGFELVVASIDQENSWDKVPQIFASIGLNKPEFFSALGKHRGKGA